MSLTKIFDISATALAAQSVRLNTTASNLAAADTVAGTPDEVYKARYPVFKAVLLTEQLGDDQGSVGVAVDGIVRADRPAKVIHDPSHPLADDNGNIYMADINVIEEMTNMIEASRAYQTNVQVASMTKRLIEATLRLGQS
ncbi:MAG: flagellar basal body rod protein FlgC [Gammaproteobacteria bacterium]|nr:MAG: flagellar basal body rod protein FlgC [Gammaproteobacteria bacterium]